MKPASRIQGLAAIFLVSVGALLITVVLRMGWDTRRLSASLTPPAAPGATSYTLSNIYTRLTTNEEATEGDHLFAPSAGPAESFHTLTEIYEAIPTIDAGKLLAGTTYLGIAGTIETETLSDASTTVNAGYYAATTLDAVDTDLAAGNIKSGTTIFGVEGTYEAGGGGVDLSSMFNGTGQGFTGGSLDNGGVDDFNNYGSPTTSRYTGTWTQCTEGNTYCGTGDSGAAYKDENTGLIWSKTMNSGTYALDDSEGLLTWFVANDCTESSGSICTKKTSGKTGCEATSGWYLPHQKQLMMAYIDGAYGNLEPAGVYRPYWSSTTISSNPTHAWYVYLSNGGTLVNGKAAGSNVRCVRPA